MNTMWLIGSGVLGAVVGSFLNVVADRVPSGRSIVRPPSHCHSCGRTLRPLELIPILSFVALRGRCQSCGARIPLRVLLVEAGTAALFVAVAAGTEPRPFNFLTLLYVSTLTVLTVTDIEHQLIPNRVVLPAIAVAALAVPFTPDHRWSDLLLGGAVTFGALFLLAVLLPKGMGMGDVKLAAFVGLIVGFPAAILLLLLAFISGGLLAGLLLLTNRLTRSDPIPFGPFLALAGLAGLFWSEPLVRLWLGSP